MSELITIVKFKQAIMNRMKTPAMSDDAAVGLAEHVLNFFGFQDRIIDNMLEPEDRDAFYMLEDVGLLTTERDETGLPDGREWRIHYWLLRQDKILQALKTSEQREKKADDPMVTIYDAIPDHVWFRRTVEEEETPGEEEEEVDEADWETPILPGQTSPVPDTGDPVFQPVRRPPPKAEEGDDEDDGEGFMTGSGESDAGDIFED